MKFSTNFFITIIFSFAMLLSSKDCTGVKKQSADDQVSEQTEQMMTEANKAVGMPNIPNFHEKKLVRDLYELRDTENLVTYTYIIDMNGNKHFLGQSIGFGIPASVQYSNPEREVHGPGSNGRSAAFTKQPEPNGLFMPDNLTATWVFLVDPNGEPRPVYVEPLIMVSPFKLH